MIEPCDGCRAYIDRLLGEKDRWVEAQFSALQRAVDKAETQMRDRLEGMNEMRAQLNRQAGLFATREAVDLLLQPINERVGRIWDIVNNWQGKIALLLGLWTTLLVLIGWVLRSAKW